MATLISSNDFLIFGPHFSLDPYLSKSLRGRTISEKLLMNFHTKFIFPKKYLSSFQPSGGDSFKIPSTLSGSMEIPALEITFPRIFPLVSPNEHFLGLRDMPYLGHLLNIFLKSVMWVLWSFEKSIKSSM